jgi:hypothetical protein
MAETFEHQRDLEAGKFPLPKLLRGKCEIHGNRSASAARRCQNVG